MRAMLALIRFEFERRWLAPVVGLAAGLMLLAMPLLPGFWGGPANDFRTLAASTTAIGYTVLLAIGLGSSLAAKDLAERRASFLFARPLSALAIATGRLLAALALVMVSAGLMLLPTLLVGGQFVVPAQNGVLIERSAVAPVLVAALTVITLLLTSAVVLTGRARTGWFAVEILGLALGGALIERAFVLPRLLGLEAAPWRLAIGLAAALLACLVVLLVVAIRVGRTDLARAHRAQAIAGAILFIATGGGALIWIHGYVWPSFEEMVPKTTRSQTLGRGLFALAAEHRGEILSVFVVDSVNGHSTRARQQHLSESVTDDLVEQAAGSLYWPALDDGDFRLVRGTPASSGLIVEPTPLEFDRFPWQWAISADGRLFAGVSEASSHDSSLEVFDVTSGRLVAGTRLAGTSWWNCQLEPERDGFRLVALAPGGAGLSMRIDREGRVSTTGTRVSGSPDWAPGFWVLDARRQRLFVRNGKPKRWLVLDTETLSEIARLEPTLLSEEGASLTYLLGLFTDGAVATSVLRDDEREITLFSEQGEPLRTVTMTASGPRQFVGLGEGRVLLLASRPDQQDRSIAAGSSIERLDLESGERRVVARDLVPLMAMPVRPGPVLLRDDSGQLSVLDPDTGLLTEVPKDS